MHSPILRFVGMIVWVITALAAIHMGLLAMGYDVIAKAGLSNMDTTIMYIVGISGVISLALFIMMIFCKKGCGCGCQCSSCSC